MTRPLPPRTELLLTTYSLPPARAVGVEIVNRSGVAIRVLWRGFANWATARWSPDGSLIAFVTGIGLVVERSDGSAERLVARWSPGGCNNGCEPLSFAWAPDGRHIAVGGVGPGTNGMEIVDLATNRRRELVTPKALSWYYVIGWSQDGRYLAFNRGSDRDGPGGELMVRDMKGNQGNRTLFAFHDRHDVAQATWSPDGRFIAFTDEGRDPRDPDCAIVNVATENVKPIRGLLTTDAAPSWSPDSSRLAVMTQSAAAATAIIGRNGRKLRRLRAPAVETTWAADGTLYLIGGNGHASKVFASLQAQTPPKLLFRLKGEGISGLDVLGG